MGLTRYKGLKMTRRIGTILRNIFVFFDGRQSCQLSFGKFPQNTVANHYSLLMFFCLQLAQLKQSSLCEKAR